MTNVAPQPVQQPQKPTVTVESPTAFLDSLVAGLMANKNISKAMTIVMVIVGALGLTHNATTNDVLAGGGILGFIAHVLNPTSDAS